MLSSCKREVSTLGQFNERDAGLQKQQAAELLRNAIRGNDDPFVTLCQAMRSSSGKPVERRILEEEDDER